MNPSGPTPKTYSLLGEVIKQPDDDEEETDSSDADCCDVCDEYDDELFFCQACKWKFCAGCWRAQAVHKPKRKGSQPAEHAKIALSVVRLVQPAFSNPADDKSLEKWLAAEEDAAWFGVGKSVKDNPLYFHDYGRYSGLMAATNAYLKSHERTSSVYEEIYDDFPFPNPRAPSLVSFVGQTGAGKSTLIKLLIQIKESAEGLNFHRPVAGLPGKDVPTSEDVHLYLDPGSSLSTNPILYADCEGIDGGAREPMATTFRHKRDEAETEWDNRETASNQPSSKRELQWAKTPLERTRQFVVAKFYPRLLFTFSDVVIFVHRNPRTIESVLEKLIEWATDALEASYNHPVLPYAVIVLNSTPANIQQSLWDVDVATEALLESLSKTLNRNVVFAQYAKSWKARGRIIENVEDLMMCYYSSVRVVHLPADTEPKLVLDQAQKLYTEITHGCKAARERKSELRMLLDEDSLQHYLQHAFDHYSRTLEIPFDFVQASFLFNPIPANFGGSILKLAIALKDQQTTPDARAIFERLSHLVASCILLDAARHRILGTADHIFPQYIKHLDYALSTFCDRHWPCEFVIRTQPDHITYDLSTYKYQNDLKFNTYFYRCANMRCGHGSTGHQLADGRILSRGNYTSKFTFENNRDEFHAGVYYILGEFLSQLPGNDKQVLQQAAATSLHRLNIQDFLHESGKENKFINLSDHTVCWSCLFEPPEHTLSCGHVLCTSCIREYGQLFSRTMVEIHQCPLEPNQTSKPQSIYFKPEAAGIRILVLDDGGIRGLIQLEILHLLEKEFNFRIPVRFFFDLVIGSGSGSIPTLGLFASDWTINECEESFSTICKEGFVGDSLHRFRNLHRRLGKSSKSRYGSANLEKTLKQVFSESQPLFGGSNAGKLGTNTKVAVSAISSNGRATLFPNYNRRSIPYPAYRLFRPETEQNEIKLWEAARASMSNQLFFNPFKHKSSNEVYSHENSNVSNPIIMADTEYKAIWRDAPSNYPDLLLWIGTGTADTEIPLSERPSSRNPSVKPKKDSLKKMKQKQSHSRSVEERQEKIWDDYLNSLPVDAPTSNFTHLNVHVPEVPASDDIDSLDFFHNMARKFIDESEIRTLASRIFATFFYFDGEIEETPNKELFLKGEILCRLSDYTPEIREIGILLQDGQFGSPGFVIQEQSKELRYFGLTSEIVDDMIFNLHFQMPGIKFRISSKTPMIDMKIRFEKSDDYSISGFPRAFKEDQSQAQAKKKSRRGDDSDDAATIHRRPQWIPPDRSRYSFDSSSSIRSFGARSQSSAHAGSSTTVSSARELDATAKAPALYELHAPVPEPRQLSGSGVLDAVRGLRERDEDLWPLDVNGELDVEVQVGDRLAWLEEQKKHADLGNRFKKGLLQSDGVGLGLGLDIGDLMLREFPLPPLSPPLSVGGSGSGLGSSRTSALRERNRSRGFGNV